MRSLVARTAPAILLTALVVACGNDGARPVEPSAPSQTARSTMASAAVPDDQTPPPDTSAPTTEPEVTTGQTPDLDSPPAPDPSASAADFPEFEWAFKQGYQEGSYGRTDYYEPSSVSKPGSMAGLAAQKAYYAGFAKGLADYQTQLDARKSSSAAAQQADQENGLVGQTLPGWDARQAVLDLWSLTDAAPCDTASASEVCVDVRYPDGKVVVLARLEPGNGSDPDHAMLMTGQARGYKVIEYWDTSEQPGSPLPDWAK